MDDDSEETRYLTCRHESVDIVFLNVGDGGFRLSGTLECHECGSVWLFEAGPE
jgi:hypothetical protein